MAPKRKLSHTGAVDQAIAEGGKHLCGGDVAVAVDIDPNMEKVVEVVLNRNRVICGGVSRVLTKLRIGLEQHRAEGCPGQSIAAFAEFAIGAGVALLTSALTSHSPHGGGPKVVRYENSGRYARHSGLAEAALTRPGIREGPYGIYLSKAIFDEG